jgi:hypothetical protein
MWGILDVILAGRKGGDQEGTIVADVVGLRVNLEYGIN